MELLKFRHFKRYYFELDSPSLGVVSRKNGDLRTELDGLHVHGQIVLDLNVELPARREHCFGSIGGH